MDYAALGMETISDLAALGYIPKAKRPVKFGEHLYLLNGPGLDFPWCIYHAGLGYTYKTRREALLFAAEHGLIMKAAVVNDNEPLNMPGAVGEWTILPEVPI